MSSGFQRYRDNGRGRAEAMTSSKSKSKVHNLLRELEAEFDKMLMENAQLKDRISNLENQNDEEVKGGGAAGAIATVATDEHDMFDKSVLKSFTKSKAIKTRHKLKVHTSKIVSSFKPPTMSCMLVKEFRGHRDGIWDISVSRLGHPLIGTASADKTARIWGVDSGRCLTAYVGHTGSVNSIAFHPTQDLALTASGDGSAHIWKAAVVPERLSHALGGGSSEESLDSESEDTDAATGANRRDSRSSSAIVNTIKVPIIALTGHQGVVSGCQWLNDELCVSSSWDRTANLYNVETGALLQSLAGHDRELTHVACHPTQRLVATCSLDSTFRLWDFRDNIPSVSVFQGHTEAVMCACFSKSEQIVSGSDDRTVKVWDLRNMRAPVTQIQTSAAVNRLSISSGGMIAIPQDNRHVVIHDLLTGQKLTRLPRDTTHTHHRMVTSSCFALEETEGKWKSRANLFTAGFDRVAFGWSIRCTKEKEEVKTSKTSKDATF